jgi:hypothetical protein
MSLTRLLRCAREPQPHHADDDHECARRARPEHRASRERCFGLVAPQAAQIVHEHPQAEACDDRGLGEERRREATVERAEDEPDEVADQQAGRIEEREIREPAAHSGVPLLGIGLVRSPDEA